MTHLLLSIAIFIITLLILITIHELGHFWVARRLNVKVLRFSFGFGKPLWRWQGRDGTEFVVAPLPLGGYVKLLDNREAPVAEAEKHRAFDTQAVWKRMAILFAGPGFNLVLGFIAFSLVFAVGIERIRPVIGAVLPNSIAEQAHIPAGSTIVAVDGQITDSWQQVGMALVKRLGDTGQLQLTILDHALATTYTVPLTHWVIDRLQPDPLTSLGIVPYHPPVVPVITKVESGSVAEKSGLRVGDRVIAVDRQPITDWLEFVKYVQQYPETLIHLEIKRAGKIVNVAVIPEKQLQGFHQVGRLGIGANPPQWSRFLRYKYQLSGSAIFKEAAQQVWNISAFNFIVLGKMLTGKISLLSIGGPITIFETSALAFQEGLVMYIAFLGLISVMLGCMNLLPIPGLDGGQIVFCAIEGVVRRPIPLRWQFLLLRLGVVMIALLMLQATINDLMRILS